jgi:preprotein translocase subunit SecE
MVVTTETGSVNSIVQYLRDTRVELRKVIWPTREQAINLTIVVLFVTGLMTVILGGIDYFYTKVLAVIFQAAGVG